MGTVALSRNQLFCLLGGFYNFRASDYKLGIRQESLCYLLLCLIVLELWKETLPLHSGSLIYKLEGLKSSSWYEVKISYPASFSLQLIKKGDSLKLNQMRRLLNTEKLIFKVESLEETNNKGGLYVLLTVEPEGIVAIPNSEERSFVVHNIGKFVKNNSWAYLTQAVQWLY
ncbi:unnamed protein product [Thlaspi arvense]|uniref:Uncharacterized protein n=1 Tax=Thlaspi arvense TaxID=13288 RepID=A0AAU9SPK0_THLAR|nr:unnamed protein product [Thlaspi arvense]